MNHLNILSTSIGRFLSIVFVSFLASSPSVAQTGICPGADVDISVQNMSFDPAALVVDVGTTIGWVNYGGFHDVNGVNSSITGLPFPNPETFALGSMNGTAEGVCLGTHTFTLPGVYFYDCTTYGHAASGMVANVTVIATVPGCMDPLACNFDITATEDDMSCVYADLGYDCDGNCLIDLDEDGICETCLDYENIVVDCECEFMDPATITVPFIDIDEENCIYTLDCYCECINDTDGDGICDENEISGCMNMSACNYNANATDDDENCLFIGDACDDGDPDTLGDVIDADCECVGTPQNKVDDLTPLSVFIYPNPASNYITVDFGNFEGSNTTVKMYDSASKLVFQKQSSTTTSIDISAFAKGVYTLEISTTEKVLRSQVVVE